ncbi:glycosyltransferase [Halomonas stenophila]|uniref:Glycosyltransferase involved in cell wall biosynthesis n=1 Tax=Halomonas stenophila TaxID=795312 RepID=A0A7W5ESJ7_9GAMM|nr:glycosyltransferase [Halomonas stenophila]MBB3229565.1 glycosyltransferase involved in cell wall biosynthesis [Halomonas stenophila]
MAAIYVVPFLKGLSMEKGEGGCRIWAQVNPTSQSSSALFITYDGLLDPLGGSQILPYLYRISDHPRRLHIVSFEKAYRFRSGERALRKVLEERGIGWTPLKFTSRMGKLGKMWDLFRMYATALRLQRRYRFGIVHCRSYPAMQVGCFLRRFTAVKTIFDMRGLWVDDRVEGNLWPQDRWLYRWLYRYYKRLERQLLECADAVVVLTDRVVPEIRRLAPGMHAPVAVIPCCADFDHFSGISASEKLVVRASIGIDKDALVISYLGSLGTVYLLDDMFRLFETVARQRDDAHLLLITRDWSPQHDAYLGQSSLAELRHRIHVRSADRDEVPRLLGASDLTLSFRRPTYSQMACSPTKLAEAFALGIPAISNAGVGDIDAITRALDAGAVVDLNDPNAFEAVSRELDSILAKGGEQLRHRARECLGLERAKHAYRSVYAQIEGLP